MIIGKNRKPPVKKNVKKESKKEEIKNMNIMITIMEIDIIILLIIIIEPSIKVLFIYGQNNNYIDLYLTLSL